MTTSTLRSTEREPMTSDEVLQRLPRKPGLNHLVNAAKWSLRYDFVKTAKETGWLTDGTGMVRLPKAEHDKLIRNYKDRDGNTPRNMDDVLPNENTTERYVEVIQVVPRHELASKGLWTRGGFSDTPTLVVTSDGEWYNAQWFCAIIRRYPNAKLSAWRRSRKSEMQLVFRVDGVIVGALMAIKQ